jgi:hypothetical protein
MATHVQLNAVNICKSSVMFGRLVSANPLSAREAASRTVDHLNRTTPVASNVHVVYLLFLALP